MPILEIGFGIAALLGLGGATIKSSRNMENGGGNAYRNQTPSYSPPQYNPLPQPQGYGGYPEVYDPGPSYGDPGGGYGYQDYGSPQNEVVLLKQGKHFYANVGFGDQVMNMMVDTGASPCVVGDEVWRWLKSQGIRSQGRSDVNIAGGVNAKAEKFTFPYLTVVGADNQSFVTVTDVDARYLPGESGLLGMSFLGRCDLQVSGDQMIIRG
jgi:hypothetical protein